MYKTINKNQLEEMMKNEKDILLLDVRTKDEFNESKIENAINISLQELINSIDEIYDYKDKKVIVYCRSGHRSVTACNLLAEEGFKNLYNLKSGITDYMN
ncbi:MULTISPECIES: rhodanese-like domain-containing protein [unclassified Clostridioides]|uniref:rhodanese-like domain-containing protein n=1 Tax=unclassified Clostridioides TaxID=2635829 RepID=UPI001D105725|nr:rhodanese-like domain-containing protein [Clostridioides sp. ZZV15-6388]MCC0644443.1 rhodanese-like domain-containing protein [Clostridioides sp. ZZV14-6150]MCC0659526.1 rhodanese-like domain-containing protein [Clostridioides sp. ZZV14-6154]MCC0664500.1 rhodanese-like domain-containing protein [Clostridioides sp. ZZV15-6597]MCC0666963.1 rhodanese-like domain-containing protein [Clostridioides sp. ZZV14-6153]MCC0719398.1 rhodanese-like domain-containing protein [Clostridioides sp. ZZV14-610